MEHCRESSLDPNISIKNSARLYIAVIAPEHISPLSSVKIRSGLSITLGNWRLNLFTKSQLVVAIVPSKYHTGRTWLNGQLLDHETATWQDALDRVSALNRERVGGYGDWRPPNIRELESLIDITAHSPAFSPTCPLSSVMEGYWSSTTSIYEPRYAWVLYTQDGAVGVGYKVLRDFHVLVVRCTANHG